MKAVIQKVAKAKVEVDNKVVGQIEKGLLILLAVHVEDTQEDVDWICKKIVQMRIFEDDSHKMNLSVRDVDGDLLVVSQFTLYALTKKGNRPSYIASAKPPKAEDFYNNAISRFENLLQKPIQTGSFGKMMDVSLVNEGPVTITIDSKAKS